MSSTDDRIQKLIERKKLEAQAEAERQANASAAKIDHDKQLSEQRAKWAADTHIISDAVKSIQEKIGELRIKLGFQHTPGNPGTTIGVGVFSGSAPGTINGTMTWNVHEGGTIKIFYGRTMKNVPTTKDFQLMTADQRAYEDHILNFVELLA